MSCSTRSRSIGSSAGPAACASWRWTGGTGPSSRSRSRRRPRRSRPASPPKGSHLADGARGEICLALDGWLGSVAAGLAGGVALVIDYGHPAATLYAEERSRGTLRAYASQRVHDDWAVAVGRQDLTAHVDFSAVDRAAIAAGLTPLGSTTQAQFLVGVGTEALLEAVRSDPSTTMEDWLAVRSSIRRLLDPRALGGFTVAAFGRHLPAEPPLAGFSLDRPA